MFYLFGFILIYLAIGAIVWFTEDIVGGAGWFEFIFWPVVIWIWGKMIVKFVKECGKGG